MQKVYTGIMPDDQTHHLIALPKTTREGSWDLKLTALVGPVGLFGIDHNGQYKLLAAGDNMAHVRGSIGDLKSLSIKVPAGEDYRLKIVTGKQAQLT